ncbi:peptide chain release factor 1 [Candidatus Latescibacterota bacterium]
MIENMEKVAARYSELEKQFSSEEVLADPALISKIAKERAELEPKIQVFEKYKGLLAQLEDSKNLVKEETDEEMIELAKMEVDSLEQECAELNEKLKIMLIPQSPLDEKDIIMEIRAGTGGEEAALFAGELFKMYSHYADIKGWKIDIMSSSPSEIGGFKEMIFSISGLRVYSHLKYESGIHRVQRVPATESSGRIHTSAASVVVMPEAKDINIEINPNDLKIDVYRSSGPGGQSVNTTDSAVRITHVPTGIIVTCQDEKSQLKNKNKAFKVLRAKLFDKANEAQRNSRSEARKTMVGSGDRSQKIRTYNFPQSRVTDHRINLSLHKLDSVLAGNLDELLEAIRAEDQKAALEEQAKESVT